MIMYNIPRMWRSSEMDLPRDSLLTMYVHCTSIIHYNIIMLYIMQYMYLRHSTPQQHLEHFGGPPSRSLHSCYAKGEWKDQPHWQLHRHQWSRGVLLCPHPRRHQQPHRYHLLHHIFIFYPYSTSPYLLIIVIVC